MALRLLHIDNDPTDARLFREALGESSIPVDLRSEPDGLAGLELVRRCAVSDADWRPDVIVCDLRMPRMDGHAFLQAVKADPATRQIPVILLTSSTLAEDAERARTLGVSRYVRKPLDFLELCTVAKEIALYCRALVGTARRRIDA